MSKIYLAGPITGVPDYRKAFDNTEKQFSQRGHIVLNPCSLPAGLTEAEYMRICMAMLDCADTVIMLDGWQDSDGAIAEYYYAVKCGKCIRYKFITLSE